jgi:hypothetical protein
VGLPARNVPLNDSSDLKASEIATIDETFLAWPRTMHDRKFAGRQRE